MGFLGALSRDRKNYALVWANVRKTVGFQKGVYGSALIHSIDGFTTKSSRK
jgi:hypothetical protein